MENASKALIIAGAILLAILIISLGILIYNQAAGVVNNNAMSEVEVQQFNQKFTQYEGTNVKGAQVNALLNQILQNNVANQEDTSKQVKILSSGVTLNKNWQSKVPPASIEKAQLQSSEVGKAMTGKTYEVSCTTDTKSGLVTAVTITGKDRKE